MPLLDLAADALIDARQHLADLVRTTRIDLGIDDTPIYYATEASHV